MAQNSSGHNQFHLTTLDPGGKTGWSHFALDRKAFSRPEHKVLQYVKWWTSGVYIGDEFSQLAQALHNINNVVSVEYLGISYLSYEVLSEDFELTQTIGGRNLLSPVRMNAVLAWECHKRSIKFVTQSRTLRTNVTRERLKQFLAPCPTPMRNKGGRWQKDQFAALQHAIVRLRRIKQDSLTHPWKLSKGGILNAEWDCACVRKRRCDLIHP